jgi:transcriptional regulator with XRE-family HTH domain
MKKIFKGFGKRLKEMRERKGISQEYLAEMLDVKRNTISNYENENSYPSLATLFEMTNILDISADALLGAIKTHDSGKINDSFESKVKGKPRGEDQIKKYILNEENLTKVDKASIKNEHTASNVQPIVVTVDNKGRDNIVMVEAKAAAGYAQHFYEPSFYSDLPTFSLPGQEFRNRTFRCFEVDGDSMENTLFKGDWVIASYCDPWPIGIREGYIYVIVTNETIYIKRILDRLNDYGKLVLLSDNESFEAKDLDGEQVRELWHVKAKLSFELSNLRRDISRKVYNLEADMLEVKKQLSDLLKRGSL